MVKQILDAMHIMAEEKMKTAPYNYCIKAQITQAFSHGKYRVRTSEQSEFNVNSLNMNFKYEVGDTVWVVIINNLFSKNRYIMGAAEPVKNTMILTSPNGTEYEVSVDDEGNLTTNKITREAE